MLLPGLPLSLILPPLAPSEHTLSLFEPAHIVADIHSAIRETIHSFAVHLN